MTLLLIVQLGEGMLRRKALDDLEIRKDRSENQIWVARFSDQSYPSDHMRVSQRGMETVMTFVN
ncbi:hypothetical protein JMJ77_0011081 [Colletotrichum scovillei]|uniref:Uncharacterized protein n=1 Tax=Colletotrichum scovillei TaxID=1209932 RepID=A0A9P7UAT5_9PEZI|nr:hypothetical protein JMJ77_0011081 [Colletotrichum scovillei]KAG7060049.1 hypothetical protein JMJ78_0015329 [Colletotrichum scovillei]KAG7067504.1 hypothetical protein JMJ76_0008937 [Colletotrichum scovillei]